MKKTTIDIKEENLYIDRDENPEILTEAEYSNDKTSALKLHCLMGFLSDDLFMCGWLMDIDKEMFHLLEQRRRITKEVNYVDIDGFVNVSVQTVELLRELTTRSGGIWNGKHQFVFIDLDENIDPTE